MSSRPMNDDEVLSEMKKMVSDMLYWVPSILSGMLTGGHGLLFLHVLMKILLNDFTNRFVYFICRPTSTKTIYVFWSICC